MRFSFVVATALLTGSCAQMPSRSASALAEETAGRVAEAPRNCIPTSNGQNLRPIDAQTVAYGWGKTIYVNHLTGPCTALRPTSILVVEAFSGDQYCRGDRVRGIEPGAAVPGSVCILNDWVPYTRR